MISRQGQCKKGRKGLSDREGAVRFEHLNYAATATYCMSSKNAILNRMRKGGGGRGYNSDRL
jgi:hypothetical protein